VVLCYHRVSTAEPHRLAVSPDAIESHLRLLLRRYEPGTAADVVGGRARVVHVTFDDAYRSIESALAILERLRVPATVFVCTGYADEGRPLRIAELRDDVDAAPEEWATLRWDELRELSERGVEIGSHTVGHAHLTRLGDDELERELRDSRAQIEDELGLACRYLAYPFGEHDARVRRAAEQVGYDAAFAVDAPRNADRWAIPRVDLYWRDTGVRGRFRLSPLLWGAARLRP
jgi:peptidoglycan/xylan/chitin deacetylase (PgdA/CDA1 family)